MNSLKFNDVCNSKIQLNHVLPSVVNLKSHKRGFVNSDYIYVTKTYPRVNSSWVPTYGVAAEMVIVELTVGAVHIAAPAVSYRALMPHVIV